MKKATLGILAGVVGSALAVWYSRRHRNVVLEHDYAQMAEGII